MSKTKMTPKQEAFVKLMDENRLLSGERRTFREMALEAGYAPGQAANPKRILTCKAVKEKVNAYIKRVEKVRTNAINEITPVKLKRSDPAKLAYITDIMTKQHQLLSGEPTERTEIDASIEKINALFIEIKNNADTTREIIQQRDT
ncbi:hypothetical protein MUP35_04385 [Patescibacteria group bacterium]|nr:hypothetical protein [Patescibacteria group bacterium]